MTGKMTIQTRDKYFISLIFFHKNTYLIPNGKNLLLKKCQKTNL